MLPDKTHFKIGEVSRLTGLKAHVLRYWESEFSALKPQKTAGGQRLYRRSDIELVLVIKRLVHEEGFTIAGAKKRLSQRKTGHAANAQLVQALRTTRAGVLELLELVDERKERR